MYFVIYIFHNTYTIEKTISALYGNTRYMTVAYHLFRETKIEIN